jgi:hypothetical protein
MTQRRDAEGQDCGLLRSWLRNVFSLGAQTRADEGSCSAQSRATGTAEASSPLSRDPAESHPGMAEACSASVGNEDVSKPTAVLLPFPIRGEALLVRLADLLRRQVGDDRPRRDPFLFALSRRHASRLTLDYQSYVEFVDKRAEFRFAIDVAPNTSITITTGDFDALVEFVVQYVSARLSETPALEAAS